jgi:hypothetical protein
MKKTIISVTFIILLIATNFIIRYIHIKNIEDNIELISTKLSESGLKFKYENITYQGVLFWNLSGKIWNPTFNQEKFGLLEKSSLDHIGFTSLLAAKKLSISLANKIDTIIKDSKDEYNYTSTFDTLPELNIEFKDYFMLYNNEKSESDKLTDFFLKYIQSIQYNSTGHKAKQINKDNSENLIYSIDKTNISLLNLSSANSNNIEFGLNVSKNKYFKNDKEDDFYNYLSEVGDSNINLNSTIFFNFKDSSEINLNKDIILKNIQPVYKLNIQEFYFSSDLFNFYLKGDAIVNKIQLLPYFDMDLKIENLTELVDFYLKFYNKIVVNSPVTKILALREIKNEERGAILKTFEKIAIPSDKTSDKTEYKLKVVNLSDKKIKINDYLMDSVLEIYNSFLVDDNDKKEVNLDPKVN